MPKERVGIVVSPGGSLSKVELRNLQMGLSASISEATKEFLRTHEGVNIKSIELKLFLPRFATFDYHTDVKNFRAMLDEQTKDFLRLRIAMILNDSEVTVEARIPVRFKFRETFRRPVTVTRYRLGFAYSTETTLVAHEADPSSIEMPKWCAALQEAVSPDRALVVPTEFNELVAKALEEGY